MPDILQMALFWGINLHLYTQQKRNNYSRVRKVTTTLKNAESFGKLLSFSCVIIVHLLCLSTYLIISGGTLFTAQLLFFNTERGLR